MHIISQVNLRYAFDTAKMFLTAKIIKESIIIPTNKNKMNLKKKIVVIRKIRTSNHQLISPLIGLLATLIH